MPYKISLCASYKDAATLSLAPDILNLQLTELYLDCFPVHNMQHVLCTVLSIMGPYSWLASRLHSDTNNKYQGNEWSLNTFDTFPPACNSNTNMYTSTTQADSDVRYIFLTQWPRSWHFWHHLLLSFIILQWSYVGYSRFEVAVV